MRQSRRKSNIQIFRRSTLTGTDRLDTPKKENTSTGQDLPEEYFKVLEIVGKYFENNISLKRGNGGKGTMTIHFKSDEEVKNFLSALEDSNFGKGRE